MLYYSNVLEKRFSVVNTYFFCIFFIRISYFVIHLIG